MKHQNSICNCYLASLVQPKPHHNNVLDKLCLSNNEQIFQIIINARDKWNLSCTIFFFVKLNGMKLHTASRQNMQTSNVLLLRTCGENCLGGKKTRLFFPELIFSLDLFFFFFSFFLVTAQKSLYISRAVRHFFGTEFEIWAGFGPEPNLRLAIEGKF